MEPQETPTPTPVDQRDMVSKTWEGFLLLRCLVSLNLWKTLGDWGGVGDGYRGLVWSQDFPRFESKLCHFLTV